MRKYARDRLAKALMASEEAVMWLLRRRLPVHWQLALFGAMDRLGCWPQTITAGPACGFKLVAPFSRRTTYCIGRHEPEVMALVTGIVRAGDTVVDVGSHLGYFTVALSRLVGPGGRVCSFEPLPAHAALLRRTIGVNGLENVTVIEQAAGAARGEALLEEWRYGALSRIVCGRPAGPGLASHRVPMTTLDDWCEESGLSRVELIKLDTEGHELPVLEGARRTIARSRPYVICEVHFCEDASSAPEAIVAWFRAAGYEVLVVPPPGCHGIDLERAFSRCRRRRLRSGGTTVLHVLASPRERPVPSLCR